MSSSTSPPEPPPIARVGKYRILSHIATGGMGTVYKAVDEEQGLKVALKVLAPELASNPILVERFRREARHAARLDHKNIVRIFEWGEVDGLHYLAMEYVHSIDLSAYIRRQGQLDPEEARLIIIQAAKALEHAAEQGIYHRDIKPSNFLLANEEGRLRVKLTDLGLARMVNEEEFRVTRAGTTVGTVDYMAPEQARDSSLADTRSDIYSLGCTLYQMLSGAPPFSEGGIGERVYKHMVVEPTDVREINPRVSIGLWTVLRRMLAKHPDDRFQTPRELIDALRSAAVGGTVEGPPSKGGGGGPVPRAGDGGERPSSSSAVTVTGLPTSGLPSPSPISLPSSPSLPSPAPERGAARRKRPTTLAEVSVEPPEELPDLLGVTPEQRQAAAGQFAHATEVIRSGGDASYALQLLTSCCELDPANVMYRKMLRQVGRDAPSKRSGGWLAAFTNLPARNRLRAARRAGEHRKVLELGEELLLRVPGDVATHLDLSSSATALNLPGLAAWFLEQARLQLPKDLTVLRALARLYEDQKRFKKAISVWEEVVRLSPTDTEAPTKIKDLAATETIARGNYE